MNELLAVGRAQLPRDRALKGLGGTGAVQGVRPGATGHQQRKEELEISLKAAYTLVSSSSEDTAHMESCLADRVAPCGSQVRTQPRWQGL